MSDTSGAVKKPKRKSRWGGKADEIAESTASSGEQVPEKPVKKRRKNRWGAGDAKQEKLANLLATLPKEQGDAYIIRLRLAELDRMALDPKKYMPPPEERSPSPEPEYDAEGRRTNTRDQVFQKKIADEKSTLIAKVLQSHPAYRDQQSRYTNKILIPQSKLPQHSIIGLIIGPRGNTHRRMEKETHCKISIRGKGAHKGKSSKGPQPGDDEELHVMIVGEAQEDVDKASQMINDIVNPTDAARLEEHKSKQLQELASINGTLLLDQKCRICGESGHRMNECPKRSQNWKAANVVCAICGDHSHVTADCKADKEEAQVMNKEYDSFMNDLLGKPQPSTSSAASTATTTATTTATMTITGATNGSKQQQPVAQSEAGQVDPSMAAYAAMYPGYGYYQQQYPGYYDPQTAAMYGAQAYGAPAPAFPPFSFPGYSSFPTYPSTEVPASVASADDSNPPDPPAHIASSSYAEHWKTCYKAYFIYYTTGQLPGYDNPQQANA